MPTLRVKERADGPHMLLTTPAHRPVTDLTSSASFEQEIDAMVQSVVQLNYDYMDQVMMTCGSLMARCTEIKLYLIRNEMHDRKLKAIRTLQLEPLMELIDFTFRASSRMVEIRRQDMELSK